jgi:hypothetical protein
MRWRRGRVDAVNRKRRIYRGNMWRDGALGHGCERAGRVVRSWFVAAMAEIDRRTRAGAERDGDASVRCAKHRAGRQRHAQANCSQRADEPNCSDQTAPH